MWLAVKSKSFEVSIEVREKLKGVIMEKGRVCQLGSVLEILVFTACWNGWKLATEMKGWKGGAKDGRRGGGGSSWNEE